MSEISDAFEQKIARIKETLEKGQSEIIWNDKISDPDNPKQGRQIDIHIKRNGHSTHVECRIRKGAQDVQWIEELIGRKLSLNADLMIGVSNSGFTNGAIKKANQHGILLRELSKLSRQEVEGWGQSTLVELRLLRFNSVSMTLKMPIQAGPSVKKTDLIQMIEKEQNRIYQIFSYVNSQVPQDLPKKGRIVSELHFNDFLIKGFKVELVTVNCEVEEVSEKVNALVVESYGDPIVPTENRSSLVETSDAGEFEVIHSEETMAFTINCSSAQIPENHFFRGMSWKVGRSGLGNIFLGSLPKTSISLKNVSVDCIFR